MPNTEQLLYQTEKADTGGVLKKAVLNTSQNSSQYSQKNTCVRVSIS